MKQHIFVLLLYVIQLYARSYLIRLHLNTYPNKAIELNGNSIGKITLVEKKKRFYLKKHSDYFFYDGTNLTLGGGMTAFELTENFFGTQIKAEDLCLTVQLGDLDMQSCCTEDQFCTVRQSFNILYLDDNEESSFTETDGTDLIERFKNKYPSFSELESEVCDDRCDY